MSRIAFTADLHVDAYGSRIDPTSGLNARLMDYLATLGHVATDARDAGADALVVAGDFTERRHPAPWLVSRIRDALGEGPLRQVYLRGNHDGEIGGRSIVSLLDDGLPNRTGVARPQVVHIGRDVALACIPYLDRHWLRAQPGFEHAPDSEVFGLLAETFVALAQGLFVEATSGPGRRRAVVLVCHQTLAGGAMSEAQQAFLGDLSLVVDTRALSAIGFDAVVAGHLHRHQQLSADPPVLYTGSIERVDFGEEHEPKGYVLADVAPGRFDWQFIETPARRFLTLDFGDPDSLEPSTWPGAIVRAINVPEENVSALRLALEDSGVFDITEIRKRPVERAAPNGGLSESLTAHQALAAYFESDPDAEALTALGREIIESVA